MSTRSTVTRAKAKAPTKAQREVAKAQKAAAQAAVDRVATRRAARTAAALSRLLTAREGNPAAFRAVGRARLEAPVQRALRAEVERADGKSLATMDRERALVIDPRSGRVVVDRTGGKNSVWLNFHPTRAHPGKRGEQTEVAGRVYVHNHPMESQAEGPDGTFGVRATFSDDDYGGSSAGIYRMKPSSAVVIHGDTAVVLRPKVAGAWPKYGSRVKPALDRHWRAIDRAFVAQARRRGQSAAARRALMNLSSADLLHLAWRRAARDTGLIYQRVPTSGLAR